MCASLASYISQKNVTALRVEASANHQQSPPVTNAPTKPAPTPPVTVAAPTTNENSEPAVAAGESLKSAPLKLQGIFFNPKNPSAVVNGRTVYLGERVAGFFVLAMSPSSVTFANSTVTNVLSLSQ
jgi:hypothetical protein